MRHPVRLSRSRGSRTWLSGPDRHPVHGVALGFGATRIGRRNVDRGFRSSCVLGSPAGGVGQGSAATARPFVRPSTCSACPASYDCSERPPQVSRARRALFCRRGPRRPRGGEALALTVRSSDSRPGLSDRFDARRTRLQRFGPQRGRGNQFPLVGEQGGVERVCGSRR